MSEQKPSIGRIVIYKVTAEQADQINRRRTSSQSIAERIKTSNPDNTKWPLGAQAHIGNSVSDGDSFPMIIVRVWSGDLVNGQAFLDGNDTLWTLSVKCGDEDGQWNWPPKV